MITDTQARKIASEWHGGGGTALYAFASTGAIDTARVAHDIKNEIASEIFSNALNLNTENEHDESSIESIARLADLWRYTYEHGTRGPVPGWANLTW